LCSRFSARRGGAFLLRRREGVVVKVRVHVVGAPLRVRS
jgi:hypothetical protein